MDVSLLNKKKEKRSAKIYLTGPSELEVLKGWNFDWFELAKTENSKIYKIQSEVIEGLLMIQFIDKDFFEMKNIEISPNNFGSKGEFVNVAQVLIAYACLLSFEFNKGPYQGYLSFISKGELIDYYTDKYNAELVFRERMQISPANGLRLIKKHLNIDL